MFATPTSTFKFVATHRHACNLTCRASFHSKTMAKHQTETRRRSLLLYSKSTTEFGELSASKIPPRLNPELVELAAKCLPWEVEDCVHKEGIGDKPGEHLSGKRWYETRQLLTKLWILPRDMSNGSWENYARAANNGEEKMLNNVPQLLRLHSREVAESAKTVLSVLKLPPAILRREPMLLTMKPERLVGGFNALLLIERNKISDRVNAVGLEDTDGTGHNDGSSPSTTATRAVRESCKDMPGLLLESAGEWERTE